MRWPRAVVQREVLLKFDTFDACKQVTEVKHFQTKVHCSHVGSCGAQGAKQQQPLAWACVLARDIKKRVYDVVRRVLETAFTHLHESVEQGVVNRREECSVEQGRRATRPPSLRRTLNTPQRPTGASEQVCG